MEARGSCLIVCFSMKYVTRLSLDIVGELEGWFGETGTNNPLKKEFTSHSA